MNGSSEYFWKKDLAWLRMEPFDVPVEVVVLMEVLLVADSKAGDVGLGGGILM
jgi:hypothetical protein